MSIVNAYKYVALDAAGARQRGTVRAAGESEAFRAVVAKGLTPLRLTQAGSGESAPLFSSGRINEHDIVALTRELAVLVEAQIPLDRGLRSIADSDNKPQVNAMVLDVASMIESGQPLSEALRHYPNAFNDVYVETVRAAEKSGNLPAVMEHLAEMLERQLETGQQLRRALTYPVIVLSVVAVAIAVILIFVVPKFADIFKGNGIELPLATRVIQGIGASVRELWWIYASLIAAAAFATTSAWRSPKGRPALERLLLRTPYVGKVIVAITAARFARVFGIGLASGLDMIESLEVGGRSTGRPVFVAECARMAERLRRGDPLTEAMRETKYLPAFARRMIGAGKDSTELARSASIVARYYDRESSHLTKNVNTIIEPILTVGMASIVLIVALAVFLPMWQMVRMHN